MTQPMMGPPMTAPQMMTQTMIAQPEPEAPATMIHGLRSIVADPGDFNGD